MNEARSEPEARLNEERERKKNLVEIEQFNLYLTIR
jgi:hypothetical protein